MSESESKLRHEIASAEWASLAPHAERQALFVVDSSLDLARVGAAIAGDETSLVAQWLEAGLVTKPSAAAMAAWQADGDKTFMFLIVQPYVLIQDNVH